MMDGKPDYQKWVYCPVCGNKTRLKLREDTVLMHFPLFCPKCKKESLIDAKNFQVRIIYTSNTGSTARYANMLA